MDNNLIDFHDDNTTTSFYTFDLDDEDVEDRQVGGRLPAENVDSVDVVKLCPAPNVTYNGSVASMTTGSADRVLAGWNSQEIRDIEFEVRVGPFPNDLQKCKLTCQEGQWIGPLCRKSPGNINYSFLIYLTYNVYYVVLCIIRHIFELI